MKKGKLKQAIFCCGNGWRKKLLCFKNASKELVAISVLPSSVCVCVAAPCNYGDRQVARSRRDTHSSLWCCCESSHLSLHPPSPGEQLRCYLGPLFFFCRIFWLVLVRHFLFAQHKDIHCMLKKPWFCFGNLHHGIWTLSKDTLVFKFICKIDIKKTDRAAQTSFSSKMQY